MVNSNYNIFINPRKWEPEMISTSLLIATILIFYLQYHWKRRHLYKLTSKIPGPRGWPFFGSLFDFTGGSDETYNQIMKHINSYPNIIKVWYGPTLVFAISKPEYLETVLTSPKAFSKMYLYKYAEPVVGYGLFNAPVPIWKRHRKIIMPAFNQKVLDGFVEVFGRQCTVMCGQLKKYAGKGEFDFFDVITRCTLDILCGTIQKFEKSMVPGILFSETAMGIEVNAQTSDSVFGQWVDRIMEIVFLRMFSFWYHFDFIFKWTKLYRDECDLIAKFNGFTEKVIKEKREAFDQKKVPSSRYKPFLDLLIELSSTSDNKLTQDEIRDEVNTFMVAGTDTTACTTGFIFMMLGMHPDIQDKVYQEVVEILGSRSVEPQDLPYFEYTERVIKESLRLFPVGAFVVRDLTDDLVLEDEVVLPKGCSVLLGIMHVHRNGRYWPDPLKFDPDRFLPEEATKRHPFAYLPFSGGPRNCIGQRYGMMAMKSMVATLIRKFKFSTSYRKIEDIELKTNLTLKPMDGFQVSVELRE